MRVLIVDDDALIRDGLNILIDVEEDMTVVGCASNGEEAYLMCKDTKPDVVLMDIRMPKVGGVRGTKMIKEMYPDTKVIILTTFKDKEYITEALKNGAEGYILKNQSSDTIIETIRTVMKGNTVLEQDVANALSSMINEKKEDVRKDVNLSPREMEVFKLIGEGLSNKEISKTLFLSEGTVRNYTTALLEKFNLRDRTQLAIHYVRYYEK